MKKYIRHYNWEKLSCFGDENGLAVRIYDHNTAEVLVSFYPELLRNLEKASDEIRKSPEIMRRAVNLDYRAIRYVHSEMKRDELVKIACTAAQINCHALLRIRNRNPYDNVHSKENILELPSVTEFEQYR